MDFLAALYWHLGSISLAMADGESRFTQSKERRGANCFCTQRGNGSHKVECAMIPNIRHVSDEFKKPLVRNLSVCLHMILLQTSRLGTGPGKGNCKK